MHDDHPATLFVALDLSRSSRVAAVGAPHTAGKVSRHKLAPGAEGLRALVGRVREQAERALGAPVRVASCYEAGRDGFWLHRALQKAGIENRVIDPASLLVDRRARRAKTDRLDAAALLRALMALCRGEPRVRAVVRAPSVEEEDARRTTRERANLLKERVRHVNRIKGLLATRGSTTTSRCGRTGSGGRVPGGARPGRGRPPRRAGGAGTQRRPAPAGAPRGAGDRRRPAPAGAARVRGAAPPAPPGAGARDARGGRGRARPGDGRG